MAYVLRLPPQSIHLSCSLLTFNSSLKSPHLSLSSNQCLDKKSNLVKTSSLSTQVTRFTLRPRNQFYSLKVRATVAETDQPKWWEKNAPNMMDIHSTQEFLDVLSQAGDRLVIVEFYGTWCASCRAMFPKLCRTAVEHPEIQFVKVNFDENKQMCKSLNVKVLPYFHFYHGADGLVESFSCSLAKFQKIKDAIETHSEAPSHTGPPKGVGDLILEPSSAPVEKSAESTSA